MSAANRPNMIIGVPAYYGSLNRPVVIQNQAAAQSKSNTPKINTNMLAQRFRNGGSIPSAGYTKKVQSTENNLFNKLSETAKAASANGTSNYDSDRISLSQRSLGTLLP